MDRSKIIHDFFQNIGAMRRFFAHAPQAPEGMPTHAGLWVMMLLAHDKNMGIKDLAKRLSFSPSAASQLVKKLETLGIVERVRREESGREVVIAFTKKGSDLVQKMKRNRMKLCEEMLSVLSDEELLEMHRLQTKVLNNLPTYGKA